MNREIKFRIWNDYDKKMIHWNELLEKNLANIFTIPSYDKWLMQYTGLHDKNGKEIYEGDIIEFSYDIFTRNFDTKVGKGIVEFIGGAFYIKSFEIEGKKVEDIDNEEWFLLYTVNTDTLEVIGNVHENLELLGGEDE